MQCVMLQHRNLIRKGPATCVREGDQNGDGLNDLDQMPYGHGFGWVDENEDGVNDRLIDADGDGINDLSQGPFAAMPFHYGFTRGHVDVEGDGIDDTNGFSYHHGFGWVDADGDGVNDLTGHHYDRGFRMEGGLTGGGGHMQPGEWPHRGNRMF